MENDSLWKSAFWGMPHRGWNLGHRRAGPLAIPGRSPCSARPVPEMLPASACLPRVFPRQTESPGLPARPVHRQQKGMGRAEECKPGRGTHSSFPLPASAHSRQSYYNAAFCALQSVRTHTHLSSSARTYSPEAPRAESVINQTAASIQDTHTLVCSAEK